MLRSNPRPFTFLVLLLAATLVLSLGLNGVLLRARVDAWPAEESEALVATTADLHLTQRLLAQCQQQHQHQDSLLVQLQTSPMPGPALAEQ